MYLEVRALVMSRESSHVQLVRFSCIFNLLQNALCLRDGLSIHDLRFDTVRSAAAFVLSCGRSRN